MLQVDTLSPTLLYCAFQHYTEPLNLSLHSIQWFPSQADNWITKPAAACYSSLVTARDLERARTLSKHSDILAMIEGTSHGTYHFLSSPSRLHAVTASCWCTPTGLQQSIYSQMHPSCRARDKEGESQHHYFNSCFVSPSEAEKVSFTLRNTKRTRWNRWNSYLQY